MELVDGEAEAVNIDHICECDRHSNDYVIPIAC